MRRRPLSGPHPSIPPHRPSSSRSSPPFLICKHSQLCFVVHKGNTIIFLSSPLNPFLPSLRIRRSPSLNSNRVLLDLSLETCHYPFGANQTFYTLLLCSSDFHRSVTARKTQLGIVVPSVHPSNPDFAHSAVTCLTSPTSFGTHSKSVSVSDFWFWRPIVRQSIAKQFLFPSGIPPFASRLLQHRYFG